jgi:hypothetical protein
MTMEHRVSIGITHVSSYRRDERRCMSARYHLPTYIQWAGWGSKDQEIQAGAGYDRRALVEFEIS